MANGHQRERAEASLAAPKRRRASVPGDAPARRGSDAAEAGGGDERSVVELETDADGMDDGYRWARRALWVLLGWGTAGRPGGPAGTASACTHPVFLRPLPAAGASTARRL